MLSLMAVMVKQDRLMLGPRNRPMRRSADCRGDSIVKSCTIYTKRSLDGKLISYIINLTTSSCYINFNDVSTVV